MVTVELFSGMVQNLQTILLTVAYLQTTLLKERLILILKVVGRFIGLNVDTMVKL